MSALIISLPQKQKICATQNEITNKKHTSENLGTLNILPRDILVYIFLNFIPLKEVSNWLSSCTLIYSQLRPYLCEKIKNHLITQCNQKEIDLRGKTIEELKQIYLNKKQPVKPTLFPTWRNSKVICTLK